MASRAEKLALRVARTMRSRAASAVFALSSVLKFVNQRLAEFDSISEERAEASAHVAMQLVHARLIVEAKIAGWMKFDPTHDVSIMGLHASSVEHIIAVLVPGYKPVSESTPSRYNRDARIIDLALSKPEDVANELFEDEE